MASVSTLPPSGKATSRARYSDKAELTFADLRHVVDTLRELAESDSETVREFRKWFDQTITLGKVLKAREHDGVNVYWGCFSSEKLAIRFGRPSIEGAGQ